MISYNVDSSVKLELSTTNYLEAGIHEDVELKSIRFGVSPKGNEFIEFSFVDPSGRSLIHTEYKPTGTDEEKVLSRTINQIKRIKQIILCFVPESEYVVHANTYKEFCENTIKIVGNRNTGKKLRVKAVYSDKGFITLPGYSKFKFIESMDIPKEKSGIRILSLDQITRPVLTGSNPTVSPFDTIADATKPNNTNPIDDLPF